MHLIIEWNKVILLKKNLLFYVTINNDQPHSPYPQFQIPYSYKIVTIPGKVPGNGFIKLILSIAKNINHYIINLTESSPIIRIFSKPDILMNGILS